MAKILKTHEALKVKNYAKYPHFGPFWPDVSAIFFGPNFGRNRNFAHFSLSLNIYINFDKIYISG